MNMHMNVQAIRLDLIDDSNRLRPVDEAYAAMLADMIKADGVTTPIDVNTLNELGKYPLIAGAHRVRAARMIGLLEIPAIVSDLDPVDAGLREVDENLMRRELSELERGVFLARRRELNNKKFPKSGRGGDRRSLSYANLARWSHFTQELSERTGLSKRSLQRTMKRHDDLGDVIDLLLGTPYANNGSELDAIARIPAGDRLPTVELLLSDRCSVSEARAKYEKHPPAPEQTPLERQVAAILASWNKADADARAAFLKAIGATLKKGRAA